MCCRALRNAMRLRCRRERDLGSRVYKELRHRCDAAGVTGLFRAASDLGKICLAQHGRLGTCHDYLACCTTDTVDLVRFVRWSHAIACKATTSSSQYTTLDGLITPFTCTCLSWQCSQLVVGIFGCVAFCLLIADALWLVGFPRQCWQCFCWRDEDCSLS